MSHSESIDLVDLFTMVNNKCSKITPNKFKISPRIHNVRNVTDTPSVFFLV